MICGHSCKDPEHLWCCCWIAKYAGGQEVQAPQFWGSGAFETRGSLEPQKHLQMSSALDLNNFEMQAIYLKDHKKSIWEQSRHGKKEV